MKRKQPEQRVQLAVGDACWTIITEDPKPSGRRTVVGPAYVRVLDVGADTVLVRVERCSPSWVVGRELRIARGELHADRAREERSKFGKLLALLWPAKLAPVFVMLLALVACGVDVEPPRVIPVQLGFGASVDDHGRELVRQALYLWSEFGFVESSEDRWAFLVMAHLDPDPHIGDKAVAGYTSYDGVTPSIVVRSSTTDYEIARIAAHEFGHALISASHLDDDDVGVMSAYSSAFSFSEADRVFVCVEAGLGCEP